MRHGLPGGRAIVDADVVAIGGQAFGLQPGLGNIQQFEQGDPLVRAKAEERTYMTGRNDQRVAKRDGVGVSDDHAMGVACLDARGWEYAEGTDQEKRRYIKKVRS